MWSPFGRFAVGFTDAEWDRQDGQVRPVWQADRTAGVTGMKPGIFQSPSLPSSPTLQPVAGRLFYPAPSSLKAAAAGTPGVPWLWDRPYAEGLGKFLFFRCASALDAFLALVVSCCMPCQLFLQRLTQWLAPLPASGCVGVCTIFYSSAWCP